MIDLSGKVVLVTGGSRGIGAAAVIKFARAGADVVVHFNQHEDEATRVAREARSHGIRAIAAQANLARFTDAEALFERTNEEFGRLDVVVANAGIWKRRPIDDLDEKSWQETIDINLKGVYAACYFASKVMKKQRSGRIITVSSTAGQRGEPFYSHYAASKGGIISFTKSLAVELGPYGITANCVAPGWVDTDMSADPLRIESKLAEITAAIPLGRIASPEDIAGPIVFLASDLARHITGEVVNVNGGSVLCG